MDENTQQQNNSGHSNWHGCCNAGSGRHHYLLRLLLGLVILGIVFCVGIKIGEFKGDMFGGGYGRHFERQGMMRYQDYDGNQYYGGGMMFNQAIPVPKNTTPGAPSGSAGATQVTPTK